MNEFMNLEYLVNKILEEVDADIKDAMTHADLNGYKMWELCQNPTLTILEWQKLRDRKREL